MPRLIALALAIALLVLICPERGRAFQRADEPEGRHELALAGTANESPEPESNVVDCAEFAAWLPATADHVERAYEIMDEIGRLSEELAFLDFIAAMKGFAVEFAALTDAQWASDPPAGVVDVNQELAITFDNYATVVREIADMLEFASVGGEVDNALLFEVWDLLPRLTEYLGSIADYLAELAADCEIDDLA